MNCKQARNLFSARLDGELAAAELRELELHFASCPEGCAERWRAFQATVELVHDLPEPEPDPAFVGRVLDQVRAYEAGRLVLSPARRRPSLLQRLQSAWGGFALPVPLRIAGAAALGVAAGLIVASSLDLGFVSGSAPVANRAAVATAPAGGASVGGSPDAAHPVRPFGDLIEGLAAREGTAAATDTAADDPLSRAVWPRDGVNSPVRVVEDNGRPQITF